MQTLQVLEKRFGKLYKHFFALKEYKVFINHLEKKKNIYTPSIFNKLQVEEKAVLEAYLKRFASIQDYLGAKIFPLFPEIAGIGATKMSEVLYFVEKEEIIDDFNTWVELREIRNELEHDYPDELKEALKDLKYCIDSFSKIERYYQNSLDFFKRYQK